jgi:hypothetical protein
LTGLLRKETFTRIIFTKFGKPNLKLSVTGNGQKPANAKTVQIIGIAREMGCTIGMGIKKMC